LAGDLKDEGAVTILAGPQAGVDYLGEIGWKRHPHRFKGHSSLFSFALQGPAEQILAYLQDPAETDWRRSPGVVCRDENGRFIANAPRMWNEKFLTRTAWDNIYRVKSSALVPFRVSEAQVLQQIGCPHAARPASIDIDYPAFMAGRGKNPIRVQSPGCSFCDVAADKGFYGSLHPEAVLQQVSGLPETSDGRKIPFELINENPLPALPHLLKKIQKRFGILRVNLTVRPDWIVRGEAQLKEAIKTAREMNASIVLGAMGFESFDNTILYNLNKGLTVSTNLKAVDLIRRLKRAFPENWGYMRSEGGNHGFIHPTPWDTPQTAANLRRRFAKYDLPSDILPRHSTPLIIHHASGLGNWIRTIEEKEGVRFERHGAIIAWWQVNGRSAL
jgi:hypothetical protein